MWGLYRPLATGRPRLQGHPLFPEPALHRGPARPSVRMGAAGRMVPCEHERAILQEQDKVPVTPCRDRDEDSAFGTNACTRSADDGMPPSRVADPQRDPGP